MDTMQQQHEEEMNDIFKRFEEEHDLRMTMMKTSMVADSQVRVLCVPCGYWIVQDLT